VGTLSESKDKGKCLDLVDDLGGDEVDDRAGEEDDDQADNGKEDRLLPGSYSSLVTLRDDQADTGNHDDDHCNQGHEIENALDHGDRSCASIGRASDIRNITENTGEGGRDGGEPPQDRCGGHGRRALDYWQHSESGEI